MLTVYPRLAVPLTHAAIHVAAARVLLAKPAASVHTASDLVVLVMLLMVAVLVTIGRQVGGLLTQLLTQFLRLAAFMAFSLMLLCLVGMAVALILLHA